MIVLSQVTDKIQVVLAASVASNQAQCLACWRDITATPSYVAGRSVANTNSTTDVDLVASPAASTQRVIDFLSVYNNDTANITVTVKFDASGTDYIIWKGTIGPGERAEYENGKGWTVVTIGGLIKTMATASVVTVVNALNAVTLGADQVNNNATPDTMQDVTGLSFPVLAGEVYWFEFEIYYTAAATTTGSRWAINGPGAPAVAYRSEYSLTTTTSTRNAHVNAYDLPAVSNASSASTAANLATIAGWIAPGAPGNVIARFASEVAGSAITAKAGSRLIWQRTL